MRSHIATLAAKAVDPNDHFWGIVIGATLVVGAVLLASGVSRSRRTGKQSAPMAITGVVMVVVCLAIAYAFRK